MRPSPGTTSAGFLIDRGLQLSSPEPPSRSTGAAATAKSQWIRTDYGKNHDLDRSAESLRATSVAVEFGADAASHLRMNLPQSDFKRRAAGPPKLSK